MPSLVVIITEILLESPIALQTVVRREQVYVLVLYAAPKAFDKYIVQSSSLPVHTQAYGSIGVGDPIGELYGGELASLIGIEDFRLSVFLYCGGQGLFTPVGGHGV